MTIPQVDATARRRPALGAPTNPTCGTAVRLDTLPQNHPMRLVTQAPGLAQWWRHRLRATTVTKLFLPSRVCTVKNGRVTSRIGHELATLVANRRWARAPR